MEQQFKIKENGFNEIRNAIFIKTITLMLLAVFCGLAIVYFNTKGKQTDLSFLYFLIPILLSALSIGIYRGVNRQKEIFNSYMLTFDNNGITREQLNTQTITISYIDIQEIIKNSNGSFTIKSNLTVNMIGVPPQIEDYNKLEELLCRIKHISTNKSNSFLQKFNLLLPVFTIGLMVSVYISQNKIIVGVCGTILILVLGYSLFAVQRSKNVDVKIKKGMGWLILIIVYILWAIYLKLVR